MVQFKKDRRSPWIVQYRDENGRVQTKSFAEKEDATKFEAFRHRMRQLIRVGMEAPDELILFGDFVAEWLNRRFKNPELTYATVAQDEGRIRNYWMPAFAKRPLISLHTNEIKNHLDHIQFTLEHSPADRNRHRALIHKIFQDAVMMGKIMHNPVSRIPLIREISKKKRTYWSGSESVESYIEALYKLGSNYGILGQILRGTGCRICEAIGLQWRDIENDVIYFRRIEERAGGSKIVERTKGAGVTSDDYQAHSVPLFPKLKAALEEHRKWTLFRLPNDFVATTRSGKYIPYDTFKDVHRRAVELAKLPYVTPHGMRRAFATAAKKAGFTRAELREILGHSTELVTARYDMKEVDHLARRGREIGFLGEPITSEEGKK